LRQPTGNAAIAMPFPVGTESRITGYVAKGSDRTGKTMARKYSKAASKDVETALHERKKGALRSGPGGKGGKVKSRKQAIAIGLSQARAEGKKVPKRAKKKS
jgi:hypothetical protein